MELEGVAFNVGVAEVGGLVSLEVAELFQETGDLDDYSEDVLVCRMVVHREPLHSLIILYDRVEPFFL